MSEQISEQLAPLFRWGPWHGPGGDPPDIWRVIHNLDKTTQLAVVNAVLTNAIKTHEAQVQGIKDVQSALAKARVSS